MPLLFLLLLFLLFSRFRSGALLAWRESMLGLRAGHGDGGVAASFDGMPPIASLRRNVHNSVRLRLRWQLRSLHSRREHGSEKTLTCLPCVREHGRILGKRISVREHGPSRGRRISVKERQGARISVREPSQRRRLGPDRPGSTSLNFSQHTSVSRHFHATARPRQRFSQAHTVADNRRLF